LIKESKFLGEKNIYLERKRKLENNHKTNFLEDVEIVVKKDENIHRYIPDKELNSELYKFCQRLILKNSHRH